MSETGNELAELLWDNGPALRRPTPPPQPFPPFTCSAAATTTAQELFKNPAPVPPLLMRGDHDDHAGHGLPLREEDHGDDDDDAVPWLHYPDADADTAQLPPDYCSALLSGFSDLPHAAAMGGREPCSSSHGAVVPSTPAASPPPPPPQPESVTKQPRTSGDGGVMNFTFFSRPLQRSSGGDSASASAAGTSSVPVESTVVQTATNLLRSTPLFSDQRMAWLQPPKPSSRPAAAAAPPLPPPPPPPLVPTTRQRDTTATVTQRLPPSEARAPDAPPPGTAATATTSSVCSGNGDRGQLKRRDNNQSAEWSASQDELDLDDEPGAHRRSAARSSKRSRTAEVHNLSERRRRDRINEKMRALQELIPNCNKIDKASMLEEAIEYLKTLQLQVQMMSMGTGLCVPPMMLPPAAAVAAMQHHMQMQQMAGPMAAAAAAAAHFPHLGAAAMGFAGFGMAGAAFDMVPMPRLAAGQFPCAMFSAAPPMAMFGPSPGQAMPSSPPPFPHTATTAGEQTPPGGAEAGDVPVVPQGGHERQQPKQT